jgi:rRNA maturation RNase YbeY
LADSDPRRDCRRAAAGSGPSARVVGARRSRQQYLKHDYNTDIITFDNSLDYITITGDIFISIDRIRANAKEYNTTVQDEFHRVMAHGVLHLLGYRDKTPQQQKIMSRMEDRCLTILK